MHLILKDGTRLNHIGAVGKTINAQGANRDAITFIFSEAYGYDELDRAFNEANCEVINIVTDGADNYHYDYVIKHEIAKKFTTNDGVTTAEIHVTMAQLTYTEKKLAELEELRAMIEAMMAANA